VARAPRASSRGNRWRCRAVNFGGRPGTGFGAKPAEPCRRTVSRNRRTALKAAPPSAPRSPASVHCQQPHRPPFAAAPTPPPSPSASCGRGAVICITYTYALVDNIGQTRT